MRGLTSAAIARAMGESTYRKTEGRRPYKKQHLNDDQLPFTVPCAGFGKRKEMMPNVTQYRFHTLRLVDGKGNPIQDSPDLLMENPNSYKNACKTMLFYPGKTQIALSSRDERSSVLSIHIQKDYGHD